MLENEIQTLRMSLQVAQANFQAEVELRQKIEEEIDKIVSELVAMAYLLIGPELAETLSLGGGSLRDMEAVDMVRLVKMQAYEKIARTQTSGDEGAMVGVPPEVAEIEGQLLALEEANKGLGEELTREQRRVETLERELEKMRVTIAMQAPPQSQRTDVLEKPEANEEEGTQPLVLGPKDQGPSGIWIIGETTAEANPDLEAEAQDLLETKVLRGEILRALIELLGGGTVCRRTEVTRILESRGMGVSRTVQRHVEKGIEAGLVEVTRPRPEISGRATHLLKLTPLGLATARHLLGRDPARPLLDRLVARHKSAEHTLLNLEAADLLRALGGTVNLFPLPVKLKNGGTLDVDLVWQYDGQVRYVECERETYKNERQRKKKWHNLYQVVRDFWIVVPDLSAQNALKNELIMWAMGQEGWLTLHLTNLTEATVDNPWLYERGAGRSPRKR